MTIFRRNPQEAIDEQKFSPRAKVTEADRVGFVAKKSRKLTFPAFCLQLPRNRVLPPPAVRMSSMPSAMPTVPAVVRTPMVATVVRISVTVIPGAESETEGGLNHHGRCWIIGGAIDRRWRTNRRYRSGVNRGRAPNNHIHRGRHGQGQADAKIKPHPGLRCCCRSEENNR